MSAPQAIRDSVYKPDASKCVAACAGLSQDSVSDGLASLQTALRLLAKRWMALNDELRELDATLACLTKKAAPRLHSRFGVGPHTVSTLLICATFEIRIVSGVVSKDHVHILVSAPPNMVPSEIMRRLKGNTSSRLFEEFVHLKKRYWGRHFWARGYFCATVRQMTQEMIKQYLEHHFEPNPDDGFKMEAP